MTDPKVSIIIPYFNKWNLTHQRLMELYKFVPDFCEIILINDASTNQDAISGAAWWQKKASRHTIRYYRNKENLGFGGSHNNGAKLAKGEVLVFLSNDVPVSGDFVSEILEVIEKEGGGVLVGGRMVYWPGGWNEFEVEGKPIVIPYLEGWMLACKKEIWEKLGGFDLRYGKFDYEDIDLSTKALSLGYNVVSLNSTFLRHISGVTIAGLGIDRMEITKKNREIFWKKWKEELPEIFTSLEKKYGQSGDVEVNPEQPGQSE